MEHLFLDRPLVNDWLCDVAADFAGRCVLVSYALSIIERVLLPERPAYFVTAGKRGGGKTTVLSMIALAVTGRKPAAAAWALDENERRKAMLAHLMEGLPTLVWDNIELGSALSCPVLEAVLTSESFSDRVLGESRKGTVPTHTIMAFTGNNISPKGDLASRSLMARLDVDRPDPENRDFTHPDPIGWTQDHRGEILAALYTVLLSNPRLKKAASERDAAGTRFKTWWHLVGSAVEQAAATLAAAHEKMAPEQDRHVASKINFSAQFAAVEGEDEDTVGLGDALRVLRNRWSTGFSSGTVITFIQAHDEKDDEDAVLLSAFLSAKRRAPGPITVKSTTAALSASRGAPVTVDAEILKLERSGLGADDRAKAAYWFEVVALGEKRREP